MAKTRIMGVEDSFMVETMDSVSLVKTSPYGDEQVDIYGVDTSGVIGQELIHSV